MMSTAARVRNALLKYRGELERLHAHLQHAHAAHVAEIDQILRELEADIAGLPNIPIRNLVLAAVQTAPQQGRTRAEIIQFIEQHWGINVNKSTATVTLNRLQNQGLITFAPQDGVWYPT